MKNLNEFINYINESMNGRLRNDTAVFYRSVLPKDRQLTIDESIEVINKCPRLYKVLLSINPDNVLVNSSSIYSAFKTMTETEEEETDDFDEDKIIEIRDKAYFSDMDSESYSKVKGDFDILKRHLSEIGPIPILDSKTITELFKRYKNGDEEARNAIWTHNLKLSVSIARRYVGRGIPMLDLIEQGYIGLLRAIEKYDYRLGYNFSTYATWWIRQAMVRYICDHSLDVRIPVHVYESINKIKIYVSAYITANNAEPTRDEVLDATGVSEKAYNLYTYITTNGFIVSLDKNVTVGGEDADTPLSDFIASDEEPFDEKVTREITYDGFEEALISCGLKPKELAIIKLRYGLEDGKIHTLDEIGHMPQFNVTRERIRQIEVRALKKLRRGKNRERMKQFREDYGTKEEVSAWTKCIRR